MRESRVISCDDLDAGIERYTRECGFRLLMIKPADCPCEARLSNGKQTIVLRSSMSLVSGSASVPKPEIRKATPVYWTAGRAGMMYRDLIPDRLGGRVIASHIRIVEGGDVPDSVHYHRVD